MLKNNLLKLLIFFLVFSCQPIDRLDRFSFDYEKLIKINIAAQKKNINNFYEANYNNPYIDHSLSNPPIIFLNNWLDKNINIFGSDNILEINIIDSSLKKSEVLNKELKKYKEKTVFLFEMSFLVEFLLYDKNNFLLASSLVETKTTTTSKKYISLQEKEKIIDQLTFNCLTDFSKKAEELIKIHFKYFIL